MPASYKQLPKNNRDLPTLLGKNFRYISKWADQNEAEFEKVMKVLADEYPAKFADVYVRVLQILSAQSKLPSHIQVNHKLEGSDMEKLSTLSKEKSEKFSDYEEIEAK